MLPEIVVSPPGQLGEQLARRLEAEAWAAVASRGRFAIALSGGSIADALYPRLSRLTLEWSNVDFFWCDERAVPPDHPESNFGVARSLWLGPAGVPDTGVHRMNADSFDLEAAGDAYAAEMLRVLGTPPRLDVALLGVGPDGHVCSLFPGHRLLTATRWVAALTDAPKPPSSRLTLTLPTLAAARLIVVAAFGENKAPAIRSAVDDPGSALPLALVLQRAARALLLLDPAAASLLRPRT